MKHAHTPPDYPYHQGLELSIKSHVAPYPFRPPFYDDRAAPRPAMRMQDNRDLPWGSPLDWCLKFPPAETIAEEDAEVGNLLILDLVSCGAKRTAQVVRCQLDEVTLIAKIFDAVYSRPENGDYTFEADANYCCEVAAYEGIQDAGMSGKYTPRYYGSWTFDLPVTLPDKPNLTRPVRMVLIEDIPGYSMSHLINNYLTPHIPPEDRLKMLAEMFRIYSELEFIGIRHHDLAPRNVMISGLSLSPSATYTIPRVVLIDFNQAECLKEPTSYHPMHKHPRPIDPRFYLGNYCMDIWKGWVPNPHRSNPAAWRGWVRSLWPMDNEFAKLKRPMFFKGVDFVLLPPEPDIRFPGRDQGDDSNGCLS